MKPFKFPLLEAARAEFGASRIEDLCVEFETSRPTARRGMRNFKLFPGVVDDNAIEFFCFGGCTLLAGALHERTGWPYLLIENRTDWCHIGVQAPSGRMVDIHGVRDVSHVLRECGGSCETRVVGTSELYQREIMCNPWDKNITTPDCRELVRYFAEKIAGNLV